MANQQAQVDALTTELGAANARAAKAHNEITAAIADLKAQVAGGQALDFAALDAAVDAAGAAAQSLDDVVPDEESGTEVPFIVPANVEEGDAS